MICVNTCLLINDILKTEMKQMAKFIFAIITAVMKCGFMPVAINILTGILAHMWDLSLLTLWTDASIILIYL